MSLVDALTRLESILIELGTPAGRALRPGVSADYVASQLAQIGLAPPEDLLTLYGWHDGSAALRGPFGKAEFLPNWWFGGVAEMVSLYRDDVHWLLEEIGGQGVEWFPILKSRTGDYHVLMRCDDAAPGEIAFISNGDFPLGRYVPSSLEEPMGWWADYIERAMYVFDSSTEIFESTWNYGDLPEPIRSSNLLI